MYYGLYKNIRHSAWQCLIDFNIDRLPVDVLKIARAAGIRVIKNSSVNILQPDENGKSFFDGSVWIIIYNDENPTEISRYTVAHELGHIFLGHDLCLGHYPQAKEVSKKSKTEQQADMFAQRLLCPACVIWGLQLHTSEDIARFCRVEKDVADIRAKRMKALYERSKFLTDPSERLLYANFCEYISEERLLKDNNFNL